MSLINIPAYAAHKPDISAVRVHENTMVVSGENLHKVQRATLGNRIVKVMPAGQELVIYCRKQDVAPCRAERWIPGSYSLKLFKANKLKPLATFPVTITGFEVQDRPELPPVIMPMPAGR